MAWDVRQDGYFDLGQGSLGTQRHFPLVNKPAMPLSIKASVRFPDLKVDYSRTYDATRELVPTDELWDALMHRLEHSSEELITRRDSGALSMYGPRSSKPLKYEIRFHLTRPSGSKEKIFRSFQKHPTTMDQAREVILATDRMVGPFLKRHDKGFRWVDGPVREHFSSRPETARPSLGGPQSLLCVPRCRFIEASQDYEFVPGYEVQVFFRSVCSSRRSRVFCKSFRIPSRECVPLNLERGEDILRRASKILDDMLDSRRKAPRHSSRRAEDGALTLDLQVKNNLGPDYDHLCHSIRSKQALFSHAEGADCVEFLEDAKRDLLDVIGRMDRGLARQNELEIKVLELRGLGWEMDQPFTLYLDDTVYYSQRSVGAVLERVQTGIANLLHGHPISIGLSATYRGHLILDKSLVAHKDTEVLGREPARAPQQERDYFVSKLKQRIRSDMVAVCKDTCKFNNTLEHLPNLHMSLNNLPAYSSDSNRSRSLEEKAPERESFVTPKNKRFALGRLSRDSAESNLDSLGSSSGGQSQVFSKSAGADDADSTPPSTPSLVDGDGETPRDSLLITPPEMKSGGNDEPTMADVRIADGEVNDTIVRDFAYLGDQVEANFKGFGPEAASQRLQSRIKDKLPDTPTPVRNLHELHEMEEDDDVPMSPLKRAVPNSAAAEEEKEEEKEEEEDESSEEETPRAGQVMQGILEYFCEPIEENEDSVEKEQPAQAEEALVEARRAEEPLPLVEELPVLDAPRMASSAEESADECTPLEAEQEEMAKTVENDRDDGEHSETEGLVEAPAIVKEYTVPSESILLANEVDAIASEEKDEVLAVPETDAREEAISHLAKAEEANNYTPEQPISEPETAELGVEIVAEQHIENGLQQVTVRDSVEEDRTEPLPLSSSLPWPMAEETCPPPTVEIDSSTITMEHSTAETEQELEPEAVERDSDTPQLEMEHDLAAEKTTTDIEEVVECSEEIHVDEPEWLQKDDIPEPEPNSDNLKSISSLAVEPQVVQPEVGVPLEPPAVEANNPFDELGEVQTGPPPVEKEDFPASDFLPEPVLPIPRPKEAQSSGHGDAAQSDCGPERMNSAPTSRRPSSNALVPRPISLVPGFQPYSSPFFDSGNSSPIIRPRSAIPFGRPSHLRHHSMSTANYLGLHEEQFICAPLGDALFGFNSRPQSSRNSPALRPVTAHGLLSIGPKTDAPTMEVANEEKELRKMGKKKKDKKSKREKAEGGGYKALNGMMMFAAGVTIASSMFHRRT